MTAETPPPYLLSEGDKSPAEIWKIKMKTKMETQFAGTIALIKKSCDKFIDDFGKLPRICVWSMPTSYKEPLNYKDYDIFIYTSIDQVTRISAHPDDFISIFKEKTGVSHLTIGEKHKNSVILKENPTPFTWKGFLHEIKHGKAQPKSQEYTFIKLEMTL
jgi:hypothetical protein